MRSTTNKYISNLDHLRALAAVMVFIWHFTHFKLGCAHDCDAVQYSMSLPFFTLLEQGHTGVALFLCISGYIFTYLTDGYRVQLVKFWLNRILRLFPLLIFWGFCESAGLWDSGDWMLIAHKLFHPDLSWTIYIELQYYLAFPVLLVSVRKFGPRILLAYLGALVAFRFAYWEMYGSVRELSYWTILGRADQFLLGTSAYYIEQWIKRRYPASRKPFALCAVAGIVGICALFQYVHALGGLQNRDEALNNHILWVVLPTLEGLFYSLIIIAYLQCRLPHMLDHKLSMLGRWSYSIYLGHIQIIPFLVIFATTRVGMPDNFYIRLFVSLVVALPFVLLLSAGTYKLIEKPFLRLRKKYVLPL